MNKGLGQLEALLHAGGILLQPAVAGILQIERGEYFVGAALMLVAGVVAALLGVPAEGKSLEAINALDDVAENAAADGAPGAAVTARPGR